MDSNRVRRVLTAVGPVAALVIMLGAILLGGHLLETSAQIVSTGLTSATKVLADAVVTDLLTVTVPNNQACHFHILFAAHANNGTNTQEHTGLITLAAAATSGGVVTATANDNIETVATTAGTLTDAWSATTAANSATLRASFNSSLDVTTALHIVLLHPAECSFTFN